MYDVVIVGGGLAGLFNSILLNRGGLQVALLEKNTYPFHRVCGEYISNEVIPFLEKENLFPSDLNPARIDTLLLSSTSGKSFVEPLDLGGFGVSRFQYDKWLAEIAKKEGVAIYDGVTATDIQSENDVFKVDCRNQPALNAKIVVAAHGKRSIMDKSLKRSFLSKKSPYVGVKYHVRVGFDDHTIALHNFQGGYCGVSKVEDDKVNICYMTHRSQVKLYGSIPEMEKNILYKNPHLEVIFKQAEFLFDQPEVINEITFEKKEPVLDHIFMTGDAAGSITPLCGNGMAMAIHSAKTLSEILLENWTKANFKREIAEAQYANAWSNLFARRLWAGRQIQTLFGSSIASEMAVITGKYIKPVARALIQQTHGQPFS